MKLRSTEFFGDKPYCQMLEAEAILNADVDRSFATDNLILLLLKEEGRVHNKNKNEQIIKLFDRYCYRKTKMIWKVIEKSEKQHIVVYGSFKNETLIKYLYKNILRYLPDTFTDLSINWGLKTNSNKLLKCIVIELYNKIFTDTEITEINDNANSLLEKY